MADFTTTLQGRAMELVAQHGGVRPASRVLMCDAGYLSRLMRGEKTEPGAALLKRMGLRREVSYAVAAPHQPASAEAGKGVEVGLTRDVNGLCVVTINGHEVIRDNGDVISHFATPHGVEPSAREIQAVEELAQLGYAWRNGLLYPPSEPVAVSGEVSDADIDRIASQMFPGGNLRDFARAVLALAGSGKGSEVGRLQFEAQAVTEQRDGAMALLFEERAKTDSLRRALAAIKVVGQIDGHDVVRRLSMLDLVDRTAA